MRELPISEAWGGSPPPDLARWFARHVRLLEHPSLPAPAAVRLTPAGYEMYLSPEGLAQPPEWRREVLLHEALHVLRGDCLVQDVDRRRWNIAADAVINERLDQAALDAGIPGVRWRSLRDDLAQRLGRDDLPDEPPGTRPIYDWLEQVRQGGEDGDNQGDGGEDGDNQGEGGEDGDNQGEGGGGGAQPFDEIGSSGDPAECRRAHQRALLDAPDGVREAAGAGLHVRQPPGAPAPTPQRIPSITRLIERLTPRGGGMSPVRARSWVREGRTPYAQGRVRAPRVSVMVAIDISGSMRDLAPAVLGAAHWLRATHDVMAVAWADRAEAFRGRALPDVGGGTDPRPMLRLACTRRPDLLIVITDGEFAAPPEPLPPCPVAWVITPGGTAPALRERDRAIEWRPE